MQDIYTLYILREPEHNLYVPHVTCESKIAIHVYLMRKIYIRGGKDA